MVNIQQVDRKLFEIVPLAKIETAALKRRLWWNCRGQQK